MEPSQHTVVIERLLGTRVMVRLRGSGDLIGAEQRIVAEMERLEDELSVFRPSSAWSRWRRGELDEPTGEIVSLLTLAADWHVRSAGAFTPLAGVLRARWTRAVDDQVVPSRDEMAELANAVQTLPYQVDGNTVERTGDCALLDLHALAKGWIIDRALDTLTEDDEIADALLDAGGDMRHLGTNPITVGIEDPRRPFDNVPPFERVRITNAAIASSSGSRRPLQIGDQRFTHVIDPRTGWPVDHVLTATAVAPAAATADALATVVGVLPVNESLTFVESLTAQGTAATALLLTADGVVHRSAHWPA